MKIIAIGEDKRFLELQQKMGNTHLLQRAYHPDEENLTDFDIIFDLNFDDDFENIKSYYTLKNTLVFVSAVKTTLNEVAYSLGERIHCILVGMNAIPGFINRDRWELSLLHFPQKRQVEEVLQILQIQPDWCKDRVGMISPRILFMIINEACYTVQEGTANIRDIDTGMKLGTNYPYGPFEWADKIGITDVFETLHALHEDTKDERYKISPLLKEHYLRNQPFIK